VELRRGDREIGKMRAATPKSKDGKIADAFPWGKQWPPPNEAGNYFGKVQDAGGVGQA
jgi:hypothetical protein